MNKRALIKEVIVDKNEGLKKDILLKFDYLKSVDSLCRELEQLLENLQRVSLNKLSAQSQRAKQLLDTIQASGVEVVPYTKKREISLRVHHFLDETDKGIVFHLYVPNGRYQEDQLASFLRLFVSYLQRVEKLQFFIDTRRTLHGQVYEFKSKNTTMNLTDMEGAFSRFGDFISLCQNDYKQAEAILVNMGINSREASNLITKYIKDYQRLMLDTRHELEQKTFEFEQNRLALRQRLESTAFELANGGDLSLTDTTHPSAFLSLVNNFGSISVNLQNPSFYINSGEQQIFEQIFNGDIHYTSEDKQLIDLFEKHAERLESVLLKSDLDQLKDTSSSEAERKTAKQKIVSFLSRVAPAIGQSALTVLTAYLEKILTGS